MIVLFRLIFRELKIFSKNKVMLAIFLGAPLFFGILLGFVYQDATVTKLPISVLDLDDTPLSHTIIDALDDNETIEVAHIIRNEYEAKSLLRDGISNAIVTLPKGLEGDVHQKRYPKIQVDVDAANILTANYAARAIQHVLATINAGIEISSLNKQGVPYEIAKDRYEPFNINFTRFYNPAANYLAFLWPGVLAAILQQVYLLIMALSFSKEFEKNTFGQLIGNSTNPLVIIAAKAIPYWIIGMLLWGFIIKIFFPYFMIPEVENSISLFVLTSLFILSLTFLGTMVSLLIPSQLKTTEVLMLIASPSFILSGFTWPLSQMPVWLQTFAQAIPLTPFLSGFRKIYFYNLTIIDLGPEIKSLGIIIIVSAVTTWMVLTSKIKTWGKMVKTA
jgi:ABC-2 type transport system permease protein